MFQIGMEKRSYIDVYCETGTLAATQLYDVRGYIHTHTHTHTHIYIYMYKGAYAMCEDALGLRVHGLSIELVQKKCDVGQVQ